VKSEKKNTKAGTRISGYQVADIRESGYQAAGRLILDNFFVSFVPFCG
jgi:hypothetical protein